MKKLLIFTICVILAVFMMFSCSKSTDKAPDVEQTTTQKSDGEKPVKPKAHYITCMSYNVLAAGGEPTDLPPDVRYPYIKDFLVECKSDILCIQEAREGEFNWYQRLPKDLMEHIDYNYVCYKELSGNKHQTSTGQIIFYKTEIFDLLDSGYQKYTDTEKQTRVFIWAKLYDKIAQRNVYVINTHWSINWDSQGNEDAAAGDEHRTKQANELLSFIKKNVKDDILFACGDYNCRNNSKWMQILCSDTYKDGGVLLGKGVGNVDQCVINPDTTKIISYEYIKLKFSYGGAEYRYSDHDPLLVRVRYK